MVVFESKDNGRLFVSWGAEGVYLNPNNYDVYYNETHIFITKKNDVNSIHGNTGFNMIKPNMVDWVASGMNVCTDTALGAGEISSTFFEVLLSSEGLL